MKDLYVTRHSNQFRLYKAGPVMLGDVYHNNVSGWMFHPFGGRDLTVGDLNDLYHVIDAFVTFGGSDQNPYIEEL